MESPLTTAEIVIGVLPIILPLAFFVVLPARPQYGFTDSGKRYRKVDSPTHIPLLSTRMFWMIFAAFMASAAAWALVEAVASAVQAGVVSLPGRRGYPRPVVAWVAAWSYFIGLACLFASVIAPWFGKQSSNMRLWLSVLAALLGVVGYALVLLSPLLSSWQGVGLILVASGVGLAYLRWSRRSSKAVLPASNDA